MNSATLLGTKSRSLSSAELNTEHPNLMTLRHTHVLEQEQGQNPGSEVAA